MHSTFGLLSNTECGVQTGESCLEAYKMLDRELTARGIPRPVVMMTDNHSSRKAEAVLAFCKKVGIRQFFEISNASGFLQALDQYNRMFHQKYRQEKERYKMARRPAGGSSQVSLNIQDFLAITCAIWPFWSSPMDRRTSFRKVGIEQDSIAAGNINRSKFSMAAPPQPAAAPMSIDVPSPAGVRKGSNAYYRHKLEASQGIIAELASREVGPAESGIMGVADAQPKRDASRRRLTDGHGSSTMQDLHGQRKRARLSREAAAAQAQTKSVARAEAKAAKSASAAALLAKWKACKDECKCAAEEKPCDASKLLLCPHCDVLKKKTCRVGSCKTAAAAIAAADAAACDPAEINIDDMEEEPDGTI
jgi:hypothetical protein